MERFLNALKAHAVALDQTQAQPRFGIVVSVDPASNTAKVTLQPENVLSGWLPVLSPWVGASWGLVCPPTPGDQVLVLAQEGDADQGVIVGRAFSNSQQPPGADVGELRLMHKSGTSILLSNDGTVRVEGDLHVNGDIYDRRGSLDRLRTHYNMHGHPMVPGRPAPQD